MAALKAELELAVTALYPVLSNCPVYSEELQVFPVFPVY